MDLKQDLKDIITILLYPAYIVLWIAIQFSNAMCGEVEQICKDFDDELKKTNRGTIIKWLKE